MQNPPSVYAFRLPPPNDGVDLFEDDFKKLHTPNWWRELWERSGWLHMTHCETLDDADALYEEAVRYEVEHQLDPFDVEISLAQREWGRTHQPRMSLFVLTADRL